MSPDFIKALLLCCLAFNYVILLLWFGVFCFAHDWDVLASQPMVPPLDRKF